jgi:uncharacterized protein (DUF488 family)
MTAGRPVFTIGHSTRTFDQFLALLHREAIAHLVDVRRFPASRRYPHFDGAALAASLRDSGITYEHAPDLGGRRSARPDSPNVGWRNASFRGYADHMATPAFIAALDRLLAQASEQLTVVMCAEAVPWRCHRTLIADAVLARGRDVRHILDASTTEHRLTSFGIIRNGMVEYPGAQGEDLFSSARPD